MLTDRRRGENEALSYICLIALYYRMTDGGAEGRMGQTDRQTDVEPGGQESKQTAIGVVRQAASPGIL